VKVIDIQNAILDSYLQWNSLVFCNYRPYGWSECDVFHLDNMKHFEEFEIKMSVSDFRNESKKRIRKSMQLCRSRKLEFVGKKHDLIKQGDSRCPSFYWFVCPDGILSPTIIPSPYGLLYCNDAGRLKTVKEAKLIHCRWRAEKELIATAVRDSGMEFKKMLLRNFKPEYRKALK
jgi:hypothetical protein